MYVTICSDFQGHNSVKPEHTYIIYNTFIDSVNVTFQRYHTSIVNKRPLICVEIKEKRRSLELQNLPENYQVFKLSSVSK